MIAGIFIYFIIIAALLLFDGVWVFVRAKKIQTPIIECNFMRYIRPVELLLSMFSITMLELVVLHFGLITDGFVNYTTIFLGVFAAVYLVDFIVKELKYKGYNFVVAAMNKNEFKQMSEGISVKSHLDDTYMQAADAKELNEKEGVSINKKTVKNYLVARAVMASFMVVAAIASTVAVAMIK